MNKISEGLKNYLNDGIKAVPSVKYAKGILGIEAALIIILLFIDLKVAVFGFFIMIIFMVVLFLFSIGIKDKSSGIKLLGKIFLWVTASISLIIFCLLLTSFFFKVPIDLYKLFFNNKTSLTIFIYDAKMGKQTPILKQKGEVILDYDGERKRKTIDENGSVIFPNISIGEKVLIDLDFSEPYKSIYLDSQFIINESTVIYLPVKLLGINEVKGFVNSEDEPLNGVTVSIGEIRTLTDSTGFYKLNIPDSLQQNKYEVWFTKPRFLSQKKIAFPQTFQDLNVLMERK